MTESGGASVFTVADGGGLQITDPSGITTAGASGNVQTAIRSYSQAGNYTYAGSAAQVVGNGLPATVNALTDLNTGGTVTLAQQTTVATVTTLAAGANLSLPASTTSTSAALVIGGTQQAAGTWGNTGSGAAHIDASHFAGSGVLSAGSTIVSTIYGGLWNTPTTWSGGVVPGSSDDVMIATFGNANAVALDGTNAIHSLTINSGARFSMSSIGLSEQLTINGNLANNGSFVRVGGTPALGNLLVFNGSSSVWTGSGNLSANKIGFTVNAGKSLDISGLSSGLVLQGGYLFVTVNGTLIAGTQVINGNLQTSPTFTLAAGGTLVSANVNGLLNGDQGTIYNFNAVNLSSAANYVFNGAADQNTYGLPATINSLTDNNTAGTVTVNQQMTIAGGVTLANGAVLSLPGGTTSTAGSLGIGGVVQLPGTWGDASSGATHIDSTHFTGGGVLSVANGPADAAHSTISPATAFILPNGISTQVITVQARDASGNKVTVGGSTVVISRSSGTGTIGGTTDNGNGTYTATVTSPLSAGSGTFTATLDGVAVGTAVGASSSLLTYTSQLVVSTSTGGAWSAPTTWAGGVVPTTSDNVVIATTGSSSVYLDVSTTVNSLTINSGAQFSMSSAAVNQTLGLNGNLNNNGMIIRVGGTPATASAIYFNGTPSVWTGSGNLSSNKVSVNVNPGKTLDISGLSSPMAFFNGTLAFTVNGTLIAGTQVISGYNVLANNTFTLAAGGTLVSANLNGITNNSSCTIYNFKNVSLSSAANYIFNGAAAQATLGLPATVNSLIDNNTGGTLTIGQQMTVAGGVSLAAGARLSLPAGTTSTAAALVMGGSIGAVGTWGNTGSGAAHIDSNFFAGTGQLSVAGSPDAAHSTITPAHAFILSDGTSTQLITVQVRDVNGNSMAVSGLTVVFSKASGTGTISGTTDNGNGTYTALVTAPSAPGSGTFTATLNGTAVGTASGASSSIVTYMNEIISSTALGGNWSDPNTWVGGIVPTNTDHVIIVNGATVTVDANASANSLTINSGGKLANNTVNIGTTLVLYGDIAANNGVSSFATGNSGPALTLTFAGNAVWSGSADLSVTKARIIVNSGVTLDISGITTGMKFRSSGTLANSVSGTLITGAQVIRDNGNVACTFTFNSGATLVTANANGIYNGTVGTFAFLTAPTLNAGVNYVFNGSAAQSTLGLLATVHSLTVNNSGGTVTLEQQTDITAALTLIAGANLSLPTGTTSTADTLVVDGSTQAAGTWGNAGSGAAHIDASHFAGSGVVNVATGSTIPTTPTPITYTVSGGTLTITWPSEYLGWILQSQSNPLNQGLGSNWVDVPGSATMTQTQITINPQTPTTFFRLRYPNP